MDDKKPRIEIGKPINNESETVAFLYNFDSIERCDYYTINELNYIIECIENTKKKIENQCVGQMSFDWRVKETYDAKEKENNKGLVGE